MNATYSFYSDNRSKAISNYTGIESVNTSELATLNGTAFPLVNIHVCAKN